jgi:hypothetical protein
MVKHISGGFRHKSVTETSRRVGLRGADAYQCQLWGAVEGRRKLPATTWAGDQVDDAADGRLADPTAVVAQERDHPVWAVGVVGGPGDADPLLAGHLDPDDAFRIDADAGAVWQRLGEFADVGDNLAREDRNSDWSRHLVDPSRRLRPEYLTGCRVTVNRDDATRRSNHGGQGCGVLGIGDGR